MGYFASRYAPGSLPALFSYNLLAMRDERPAKPPVSSKQREAEARKAIVYGVNPERGGPGVVKPPADKAKRRRYLREYFNWLWPYRLSLGLAFFLAFLTTALDLVWPLAIKKVIDGVLVPAGTGARAVDFRTLHVLGVAILVMLVAKQGPDAVRSYQLTL